MATTAVDIVVKVNGTSKIDKLAQALKGLDASSDKTAKALPKTAAGAKATGIAAKGAAGGVRSLGAAFKTALGPIGAALAAIGGVTAAFNTLKSQDFAERKFETLGGNADQLVTNLREVTKELQGQASVVELTGAAYDVASAGFTSAAEATLVLKAASQGAIGGFSDINTVANAATSVLNAYGLSADKAGKLVDQFIQTQNDGKIVVAEYAQNIGKVASAAAGLKIPLEEVNAVIAQSTAAGVQSEVAFTGLKGALARLASGEASKALSGFGIEINAATIEADGLLGTLEKLQGLDTGALLKALGTEAGPALLPVIQNLERYEELLNNQKAANGTAAAAAATAAGTIEGAWNRVTVAFQNLFSDQSELGQVIRGTLLAAAATVELFAAAFKLAVAPIRAVIEVIGGVVGAMTGVKNTESVLTSFTDLWFDAIRAVEDAANNIIAFGKVVGDYIGRLITTVSGWFSGLWSSISNGVQGIVGAITGAFSEAFEKAKSIIMGFWNSLPGWLKNALSFAGNVVGGVTGAVRDAIGGVVQDIQDAKASVDIQVKGASDSSVSVPDFPTFSPGGGVSGGGGGVSGGAAQQVKDYSDKIRLQQQSLELLKFDLALEKEKDPMRRVELEYLKNVTKLEQDIANKKLDANSQLRQELDKELSVRRQILDVQFDSARQDVSKSQVLKGVQAGADADSKLKDDAKELDNLYKGIGDTIQTGIIDAIGTGIEGLIKGTKDLGDALQEIASGILADIGKQLLNFGVKSALGSLLPGFADGGRPPVGEVSLVGERGPELFVPDSSGTILSNEQSKAAMSRYSAANSIEGLAMQGRSGGRGTDGISRGYTDAPMNVSMEYSGPTMVFDDERYLPVLRSPASLIKPLRRVRQKPLVACATHLAPAGSSAV